MPRFQTGFVKEMVTVVIYNKKVNSATLAESGSSFSVHTSSLYVLRFLIQLSLKLRF